MSESRPVTTQCDNCGAYVPNEEIWAVGSDDELWCAACAVVGECDCCGKRGVIKFGIAVGGLETFACRECFA